MQILGLDFATKTGVAKGYAGAPAARVECETWELPSGGGADVGAFMYALRNHLDDTIMRGVELVVFEAPYIAQHRGEGGRINYSPNQVQRAFGAAAICEEVCYARRVPCFQAATVTLKKDMTGSGRAEKSDMIKHARRRGFTVGNDHEADACAAWLHGVIHQFPEHAALYDPLFNGTRS